MSTFDGVVDEFPLIRIDCFTPLPDKPYPLACFLSHVHSDHTRGLQTLRSPFVYCSSTTKEILLNIERYGPRADYTDGVTEAKDKTFKHLRKLLRPVPLGVPTQIRLTPRESVRVTLFDANHCPGSVMFLIEGSGKAILYTGDIRAEKWWVGALMRHPVLIPYIHGHKTIDTIYMDTTFARHQDIYRSFPSKAEGISELLTSVAKYPVDTTIYLRIATLGYEDVWQALSGKLGCQIHVDRYQWGLFASLCSKDVMAAGAVEGPALCGFNLGHERAPGCLTRDETRARVHSCEPRCPTLSRREFVILRPIVNRLYQEVSVPPVMAADQEQVRDETRGGLTPEHSEAAQDMGASHSSGTLSFILDDTGVRVEFDHGTVVSNDKLGRDRTDETCSNAIQHATDVGRYESALPTVIRFPFSRHSSYNELRDLIAAFRPRDIIPCVVPEQEWREELSMQNLFGDLCTGTTFRHDNHLRRKSQRPEAVSESKSDLHRFINQSSHSQQVSSGTSEHLSPVQGVDSDESRTKRLRLVDCPATHIVDLATPEAIIQGQTAPPDSVNMEYSATKPGVEVADKQSQQHADAMESQASATSATQAPACLIRELKRLRAAGHLAFRVITDSCPDSLPDSQVSRSGSNEEAMRAMLPEHTTSSVATSPIQTVACSPTAVLNRSSTPDTPTAPSTINAEVTVVRDTVVCKDAESARQSQASVVTLSTGDLLSQDSATSIACDASAMSGRRTSGATCKEAYKAAQSGSYEAWANVYTGPYLHEDEV